MSPPHSQAEIIAHNQAALAELERAISLRPQRFSLILARCNYARLRSQLVQHLQETMALAVVPLSPQTRHLRQTLEQALPPAAAKALLVTGLDYIQLLPSLLQAANLGRDEFPKTLTLPVVIWVNDLTLPLISRHAPDLKSFAGTPISFEYPPGELVYALHRQANALFQTMLSLGDDSPYPDYTPAYQPGSSLRTELEFALAEIGQASAVDPRSPIGRTGSPPALPLSSPPDQELQASLDFLQGRDALSRGNFDLARYYFDLSLHYWQQNLDHFDQRRSPGSPPPPCPAYKQALLWFYLGVTWRSRAVLERSLYQPLLAKAQACFRDCLEIFRRHQQPQLVGRFLHALAEVRQKLEDWNGLERIAQEGLTLHRSDGVRLARDHGYLAEVAMARGEPELAQFHAQKALDILKIATAVAGYPSQPVDAASGSEAPAEVGLDGSTTGSHPDPMASLAHRYHRGWYLYLLAQAQLAQGHPLAAIALLQQARHHSHPKHDLSLHQRILETLRDQYFQQKNYRAAFHVKLDQRQIDTRFRRRAFIGASPIQPQDDWLATEIDASGRQADVQALVTRLALPRYPLVILHGPSGVGKSSMLVGGLIPALARSFPEGRSTLPLLIQNYRDWPQSLYQAIETTLLANPTLAEAVPIPDAGGVEGPGLLARLRHLIDHHSLQVVLLFDQVEEFFADVPDRAERQDFYSFLVGCLEVPYLKVLLALREDYLHYLLEIERGFDLDILNQDILCRDHRYYLGDFTPQAAKTLIRRLTNQVRFYLEDGLVEQLVTDLAGPDHQVKPIELQVVGAQLQRQGIDRLATYQNLGPCPKETLVEQFLDTVINDCGPENAPLAQAVLYLLTDRHDRNQYLYRPKKSQDDLEAELTLRQFPYTPEQLDLVLEILVGSGLIFHIPDIPMAQYQLVHDYLMNYVRSPATLDQLGWSGAAPVTTWAPSSPTPPGPPAETAPPGTPAGR
jgi:tetratricopeptide (TPR) repeat protein